MSNSYRQIFKSTSLIGGASLLSGGIHLLQNKVVAVLLGAPGIALLDIFNSIINLVGSIVNLGLGSSGVRQIAEAAGETPVPERKIAEIITAYRHIIWITGTLGLVMTAAFAPLISRWFFKSPEYAWGIACLGIAVLLGGISAGQQCVIQGMRRIGDLSRLRILAALAAAFCAIPCFFIWKQQGIVPALIAAAIATLLITWWIANRHPVQNIALDFAAHRWILMPMLRLGLCFMASSIIMSGSIFLHRMLLTRMLGIEGCGLYQSAFALSSFLIGFVLNAMGTDYYPRLVGLAGDPKAMENAINEQMEISLLLGIPPLLGMMALAPVLISVFYAASFAPAGDLIRLFLFGILGQVFVWPLGYAIIARGDGKIFVLAQIIPHGMHFLLLYLGIRFGGLKGAALSLFGSYLFSATVICILLRFYYQLRIARLVLGMTFAAVGLLAIALMAALLLGFWMQLLINTILAGLAGTWCLYFLTRRLNFPLFDLLKRKLNFNGK